jgi:hypothetical protein
MKMEPNKIESQFKQKLEQRTIQPTEMAWDRLDAMLSVAEKKKKRPNRNCGCFFSIPPGWSTVLKPGKRK